MGIYEMFSTRTSDRQVQNGVLSYRNYTNDIA